MSSSRPLAALRSLVRIFAAVALLSIAAVLGGARTAFAQVADGYASVMVDVLPDVELPPRSTVSELRARLFLERRFDIGDVVRVEASGFTEGLVGDRGRGETTRAAIVRARELHAEFVWTKADLRVGMSRVAWGRLDEFLPTDVVNPLDLTRFFLEGRAEARMPVAMVRGRFVPSDRLTLEAIYVPLFRRARFDQLDEPTSPFNVAPLARLAVREPAHTWTNGQGGVRANVTSGRVDWALTAYRGFETLPVYRFEDAGPVGAFPRFTMIGGDFETVHGPWGVRGEAALFIDRTFQVDDQPLTAQGHAFDGGIGIDRRAGDYRIAANLLVARRSAAGPPSLEATDTTVVASIDRSFARQTRSVRVFTVYNPVEDSAFARVIASFSLRDDVTLEASAGWFGGSGVDTLSRLASRDFAYARLKVFY
jgi:hypothetical protein